MGAVESLLRTSLEKGYQSPLIGPDAAKCKGLSADLFWTSAEDVRAAVEKAEAAALVWEATPADRRGGVLAKAADVLEYRAHKLIPHMLREVGLTSSLAAIEIKIAAGLMRAAAETARAESARPRKTVDAAGFCEELMRVPHGVVGTITSPSCALILAVRVISAALATGNAVVHKPDPVTALSGGILIAMVFEEAGLPDDVLQVLCGGADVGLAMCEDPGIAMVSFTGSPEIGSKVGETCGRNLKKVQLELSGKNAIVIMDDADLEVAASNCAWGTWIHRGQICLSVGLILVHESQLDVLAGILADTAKNLQDNDPFAELGGVGPLADAEHARFIEEIVADAIDKGADVRAGGLATGNVFPATVLSKVRPGMRAFSEEVFGPVAVIAAYRDEDHAVELATMNDYGLAAGVIGKDVARARALGDRLRVGHLHINDQTVNGNPIAPFAGRGRSGNGSGVFGPAIWEEFSRWVWVTTKPEATSYPY